MCGGEEDLEWDYLQSPYTTPDHLKPVPAGLAKDGDLVVEDFPLTYEGYTYRRSRIAYVKGRGPVPAVIVHHNYAGLKQFDVDVACFLAKVGYTGVAVDCYEEKPGYRYSDRNVVEDRSTDEGEARIQNHFRRAFECMNERLWTPRRWRGLMRAYLDKAFEHPAVHSGLAAAIGYGFGGQSVLEQLRAGHRLQAAVSFHGLLNSRPMYKEDACNVKRRITSAEYAKEVDAPRNLYTKGCRVVIEHGDLDSQVASESIEEFKREMDTHSVDWCIHNHARARHGFALANGLTEGGSYNEVADRRSTLAMLAVFAEAWPEFEQEHVGANACGTLLGSWSPHRGTCMCGVCVRGKSKKPRLNSYVSIH
eukprot:gnl/TRDRNA2_/TRDRNA2_88132_c0_seq1.p1 gnl/TRDRNA2_/TRDRNA2_88132_c0~~gnl/TRDRNA2_/TRDRNA2_88132_c0_seq1.p1  ORF type:complete len:364 (-),score=57.84 gnl/TRDRNA2_/TRDRNA2_88132_c0_seq1:228-1319(-)